MKRIIIALAFLFPFAVFAQDRTKADDFKVTDPATGMVTGLYDIIDGINTQIQSSGSVVSVGLTLPSFITVTGSPITTTGTLTGVLATQTANTIFAGPNTGSAAAPTFRALVSDDIPASVSLTGVPAAPTATTGTSTTQIATTEFVADESALINASLQQWIDETVPAYGEAHSTAIRTYSSGGTQVVDTLVSTGLDGFTQSVGILTNMTGDSLWAELSFSATIEHVATALNFTAEISNGTNAYHDGCKISTTLITGEPQDVSVSCIALLPTSVGSRVIITSVGTYQLTNVSFMAEKIKKQ